MEDQPLFNLADYTLPSPDELDMTETKRQIKQLIAAYRFERSNNGMRREPPVTSTLSLVTASFSNQFHSTTEQAAMDNLKNSQAYSRYQFLHERMARGLEGIDYPFDADKRIRRKNVFVRKMIRGENRIKTMKELHIEKDAYNDDLNWACTQFAYEIGIHVWKNAKTE
ncbi:hypothetical protein HCA78_12780 [Listeria booriae]|uniref:ArpU family transcriptional regulator n=1 Tax=Listeria booriae TaxID=1552123 RepID=A0A842CR27_9LIST|nr:ArpU family phage packaging/lysis transcriptional regulator [Listeria booriae]MBC2004651.1 hypothetical protein [Listeria booriae]MBC2190523.1 hypothetical protein [Listeria booriae]MBC6163308.1 hypothetical protein [Listeria booriae]